MYIVRKNNIFLICFITLILADIGKGATRTSSNSVGIKLGLFSPTELTSVFPLVISSDEELPLFFDNLVLHLAYRRRFDQRFYMDVEFGFQGLRDNNSSYQHLYLLMPFSATMMYQFPVLHSYKPSIGTGLDYWLAQEEIWGKSEYTAISGYHAKLALRHWNYTAEIIYSTINSFGTYDWDLGGISFNIALHKHF